MAACTFSLGIAGQVLTFRTKAWLSFAPPTCRMPLGQSQCIPQANPGRRVSPRFWHRLISFRHFVSGSLALASLNLACRNLAPAFPQRSPPLLLATAACGGLRSAPDRRPRRVNLHLSYSCGWPFGPAILVTQDQLADSNCAPRTYMSNYSVMAEANKISLFEIESRARPGLFSQIPRRACQERNFPGQRLAPRKPEMPCTETG